MSDGNRCFVSVLRSQCGQWRTHSENRQDRNFQQVGLCARVSKPLREMTMFLEGIFFFCGCASPFNF